jgi:hypothetical protein
MNKKRILSTAIATLAAITLTFGWTSLDKSNTAYATVNLTNWNPGHYLLDNDKFSISHGDFDTWLTQRSLDGTPIFRGIQKKYSWNELEVPNASQPGQYIYDFSEITADLNHLASLTDSNGNPVPSKLVIQLQTKAFGEGETATPAYIQGSYYGGGVYETATGSYNPIRWNDNVRDRIKALYAALGTSFNGNSSLESVILSETAQSNQPANINSQSISPAFSYSVYTSAISDENVALKAAFPNTVTIQFTNFPQQSLNGLFAAELANGVGSGGPDIKAYSAINTSLIGTNTAPGAYSYYANAWNYSSVQGKTLAGIVPLGTAVQSADYFQDDAKTIPANINDLYNFGHDQLHLNYIYWLYNANRINDVVNFLKTKVTSTDKAGGLYTTLPTAYQ